MLSKKSFFIFVIILLFIFILFGIKLKVLFDSESEDFAHPLINKSIQTVSFQIFKGKTRFVTIKDLIGDDSSWIILHFWTSHCQSCKAETPELNRFYESLKKAFKVAPKLKFYSCNVYNNQDEITTFQEKYSIKYPILFNGDHSSSLEFGVIGTPATYLISSQGKIKWYGNGSLNSKKIIDVFKKMSH